MFSCSPSSRCEPYPLPLPLTVIHPRAPCTSAAGVSAILQHSSPAFPAHSYSVEPCLHFPACNQPWLRHTAADQFFSFNPTIVPNHHTHIQYHTHPQCWSPRHCNIPIFPTLIKWKKSFSRYCTLGIRDFRKIWFRKRPDSPPCASLFNQPTMTLSLDLTFSSLYISVLLWMFICNYSADTVDNPQPLIIQYWESRKFQEIAGWIKPFNLVMLPCLEDLQQMFIGRFM